jgi:chaperonin GroES
MPTESDILRSFVDDESPEDDPETDAAQDALEVSVGITPDDADTKELEDGGALITMSDARDVKRSMEFYTNLAEDMDESELNDIATKILDLLDKDEIARKERDKQYEDGLRRTGLGNDSPGGADFEGASKVTHPLMLEVAIDFSARAIKELWPADGPVKDKIIGTPTDKKQSKADRKKNYMNWQLTEKMPSVRYEIEQILTQVPQGGVAYSKLWQDTRRKTPCHEPVWVDEIRLPWGATNFYKSDRKTHVMMLNDYTFRDRTRSGMYREIDGVVSTVTDPEQTRAAKANDKIEGKSSTSYNEDGIRRVFEVDIQYIVTDEKRGIKDPSDTDEGPAPYLITIDDSTHKVLSIYRNWDENDENLEALVHIIEWPFLPWRGAMPIGTPQVLGGIAAAATGALRALLDSAHINNFPGGMRLKSGPVGGQSVRVEVGQTNEIDGGVMQDDIRKTFMPTPVNQTSPVLYELLGYLVDAGKEVIKTTLDEANDNANVPVGTTMARIEQGMVVFSAIHSRLHNAMGKFLKVLHRLNATYLDDKQIVKETGEQMAFKADFDAPNDVVPVSDPEIFSELQRSAQMQTVAQRAQLFPQLYDLYKVEEGILKMMKIKDPAQYLKPQPKAKPQHAINENIAAALGQPILAFPDQDHLAHLQAHLSFIEDPVFGQNPLMAPQAIPAILQNVKEHLLFQYGKMVMDACTEAADGADLTEFMSIKDASIKTAFDQMLAAATQSVHPEVQKMFAQVMPVIKQAQSLLQQFQPPTPIDPSVVAQQKVQSDSQNNAAKNALAQQSLAQQASLKQAELAQDAQTSAGEAQTTQAVTQANNQTKVATTQASNTSHEKIAQMSDATKQQTTQEDNNTAMEISAAEIEAGKKSQLTDGAGVGGKPRTQ